MMDRRDTPKPQNRLEVAMLLVAAVGVWGAVGLRLWEGPADEVPSTVAPVATPEAPTNARLAERYEADFADPFAPGATVQTGSSSLSQPTTGQTASGDGQSDDGLPAMDDLEALRRYSGGPEPTPPPEPQEPEVVWRLRGVVGDAAILESEAGVTRLARAGDALGDDEVVAVFPEGIRVRGRGGEYNVMVR